MEHLLPIECTEAEFAELLAEFTTVQRYEILKKAIKPKVSPTDPQRVTLRPETPVTETIGEVRLTGNLLTAKLVEKNEDWRQVAKYQCGMEFDWDRRGWVRKIGKFAGDPIDRAVELCHRLLAAGFVIEVDAAWVDAISAAQYQPEQTKWITRRVDGGKYNDWFTVGWGKRDDYYEVARRIKGSRYVNGDVLIPQSQFEAILDFAEQYGFSLSDGAHELIAIAKAKRDAAILTSVEKPTHRKRTVVKDVRPVLTPVAEEGIADEFADDIA